MISVVKWFDSGKGLLITEAVFFFQAEDGIRDRSPSRGLGDVYKRQRTACTAGRFVRPGALLGDHRRHLCHLLLHPSQLLGKGAVLPHPLAHLLNLSLIHI